MNQQRLVTSGLSLLVSLALIIPAATATPWAQDEQTLERIAIQVAREMERGGYELLSIEELRQRMETETDLLIVDTMPYVSSYQKAHIPGAVQIEFPIEEMTEISAELEAELIELLGEDRDRPLVFYCGLTKCGRSHNGAMWAERLGYTQVYRTPGGIKAWQQAGYPVESVD